jgi:hypothetical protein
MAKVKNQPLNFDDEVFYWRKRVQLERRFFPEKFNHFAKASPPELSTSARAFDLDPADTIESAVLLRALAQLLFQQRARGRPVGSRVWGSERLIGLWNHYTQVRKENPRVKKERAAQEIKTRWPDIYKTDSVTTLRQRIPNAQEAQALLKKRLHVDFDDFIREGELLEWEELEELELEWEELEEDERMEEESMEGWIEKRTEERREEERVEEERREEERREEERREEERMEEECRRKERLSRYGDDE